MAEGEEPLETPAADAVLPAAEAEEDGWPVLSDLELDVCLSDARTPGVPRETET